MSSTRSRFDLSIAIALAAAVVGGVLTQLAVQVGVLSGVGAIIAVIIVWVVIPSARGLARRIAINGALGLGLIPVLWWIRLPLPDGVGRFGLLLGVATAVIVFFLLRGRHTRRLLIPEVKWPDALLGVTAVVLSWLYLPFQTYSSGVASVTMLRYGYGGDNVAHFNMFEMIRRLSGAGPTWPVSADGTFPAYTFYPQQFHTLVALAAEAWDGVGLQTVDRETGLFGIGLSLTLSAAALTLVAAILSIRLLRRRPGLIVLVGILAISFPLLGAGAQAIPFGFPNFLLAVIGSLIAIVIAIDGRRSVVGLAATGAMVLLVAHSWSLLTTMPGVALLMLIVRIPWRRWRDNVGTSVAEAAIIVLTFAGVIYAAILVEAATRAEGTAVEALAIPGAVPQAPVTAFFAMGLITLGVACALIWGFGPRQVNRRGLLRGATIAAVAAIALLEATALILIQLRVAETLGYFQYKFIIGVSLIMSVVLVLAVTLWIARLPLPKARHRLASITSLVLIGAGVFSYAILPAAPSATLSNFRPYGYLVRSDLQVAANIQDGAIDRLLAAASLMSEQPCPRPIFFDPAAEDGMSEANQWAMALSGKWTVAASEINSYIFDRVSKRTAQELTTTARTLLEGSPDRCLIMSSEAIANLDPDMSREFADRILAYDR